jgi:hypothetical protein
VFTILGTEYEAVKNCFFFVKKYCLFIKIAAKCQPITNGIKQESVKTAGEGLQTLFYKRDVFHTKYFY